MIDSWLMISNNYNEEMMLGRFGFSSCQVVCLSSLENLREANISFPEFIEVQFMSDCPFSFVSLVLFGTFSILPAYLVHNPSFCKAFIIISNIYFRFKA